MICEICIIQDTIEDATRKCETCRLSICDDAHLLDHDRIDNAALVEIIMRPLIEEATLSN